MSRPTERDFERSNLLLAFTAGAGAMALAVMLVLTFSGQLLCN
jgi:hypothetical protein